MRFPTPRRSLLALVAAATLAATGVACDAQDPPAGNPPADGSPPAVDADVLRHAARIDFGHTRGDPDAPIQIVEFSDFGCPYCARFARTTLPIIQEEYIDAGIVHWRYVPVVFGFPGGEVMGAASVCAAELGGAEAFWRAHDLLYTRQVALRGDDTRDRVLEWFPEIGLDRAQLEQCLDSPATRQLLIAHTRASQEWYVRGTPTFLVNGVPMSGAVPIDFFRKVFATVLDPSGL